MKVAHILSQESFIDKHIIKYEKSNFHNSFIYLRMNYAYQGKYDQQLQYINPGSPAYAELVDRIDRYDMVILYFLTRDKMKLVEDISTSRTIIVWSFYGAELYTLPLLKYKMLSERTLLALDIKWKFLHLGKGMDILRTWVHALKGKPTNYQLTKRVLPRIDYFLWYNPFEYELLNRYFGQKLPPFLAYSITDWMEGVVPNKEKKNSVVVGNSRDPYNNHLDAIGLLKESGYKGRVSIPFSYGNSFKYNQKVKREAGASGLQINFIEAYVPYEQYIENLNEHSAAIYPSYRQMGLGNVLIAVRCGLKIYLSERNTTLKWLRHEGMRIYSFENDLNNDVLNDDLKLDPQSMQANLNIYSRMVNPSNTLELFKALEKTIPVP